MDHDTINTTHFLVAVSIFQLFILRYTTKIEDVITSANAKQTRLTKSSYMDFHLGATISILVISMIQLIKRSRYSVNKNWKSQTKIGNDETFYDISRLFQPSSRKKRCTTSQLENGIARKEHEIKFAGKDWI